MFLNVERFFEKNFNLVSARKKNHVPQNKFHAPEKSLHPKKNFMYTTVPTPGLIHDILFN